MTREGTAAREGIVTGEGTKAGEGTVAGEGTAAGEGTVAGEGAVAGGVGRLATVTEPGGGTLRLSPLMFFFKGKIRFGAFFLLQRPWRLSCRLLEVPGCVSPQPGRLHDTHTALHCAAWLSG